MRLLQLRRWHPAVSLRGANATKQSLPVEIAVANPVPASDLWLLRRDAAPTLQALTFPSPPTPDATPAGRIRIHIDAQDFEFPVLERPEIQIVHLNRRSIFCLPHEMQRRHEFVAVDDNVRGTSLIINETTCQVLVEGSQRRFPANPCSPDIGLIINASSAKSDKMPSTSPLVT